MVGVRHSHLDGAGRSWTVSDEKEPQEEHSGRPGARHPRTRAGRRRHRGRLAATEPARPLPSIPRVGGAGSTKAEKGACSTRPLIQVHFPHTEGVLTYKKNLDETHAFGFPRTTDPGARWLSGSLHPLFIPRNGSAQVRLPEVLILKGAEPRLETGRPVSVQRFPGRHLHPGRGQRLSPFSALLCYLLVAPRRNAS